MIQQEVDQKAVKFQIVVKSSWGVKRWPGSLEPPLGVEEIAEPFKSKFNGFNDTACFLIAPNCAKLSLNWRWIDGVR